MSSCCAREEPGGRRLGECPAACTGGPSLQRHRHLAGHRERHALVWSERDAPGDDDLQGKKTRAWRSGQVINGRFFQINNAKGLVRAAID